MSGAYYNENDPKAVAWLRELITSKMIADGEVDDRSILDVRPADLAGFTQCHFFAGIGVWSYALRRSGWSDRTPVWTGSCPCQPFSAAGKGGGFDDERHLWPAWYHLIEVIRPAAILGEQVASKGADPWIDLVQTDLETLGYAFGAVPFPAAGIGAPHIRDRTYWVADSGRQRLEGIGLHVQPGQSRVDHAETGRGSQADGMADATGVGRREECKDAGRDSAGDRPERISTGSVPGRDVSGLADPDGGHAGAEREQRSGQHGQQPEDSVTCGLGNADIQRPQGWGKRWVGSSERFVGQTGVAGFWADADWIPCRDGKWRPIEPGTFPLAHGAPARVGRLRGYGNAIVAEAAAEFIRAYQGHCDEPRASETVTTYRVTALSRSGSPE